MSIPIGSTCVLFTLPCNPQDLTNKLVALLNDNTEGTPSALIQLGAYGNPEVINSEGQAVISKGTVFAVQTDNSASDPSNTVVLTVPAIVGIVVVAVILVVAVAVGIIFFRKSSAKGDEHMAEIV
jgi:hypothetical protein